MKFSQKPLLPHAVTIAGADNANQAHGPAVQDALLPDRVLVAYSRCLLLCHPSSLLSTRIADDMLALESSVLANVNGLQDT